MLRRDAFVPATYMGRLAVTVLRLRVRAASSLSHSLKSSSFTTTAFTNPLPRPHHHRAICRHPPLSPTQTHHVHPSTVLLPYTPSQLHAHSLITHRSFSLLHRPSPYTPSYSAINPTIRTFATMAELIVSESGGRQMSRLAKAFQNVHFV